MTGQNDHWHWFLSLKMAVTDHCWAVILNVELRKNDTISFKLGLHGGIRYLYSLGKWDLPFALKKALAIHQPWNLTEMCHITQGVLSLAAVSKNFRKLPT